MDEELYCIECGCKLEPDEAYFAEDEDGPFCATCYDDIFGILHGNSLIFDKAA